MELRTHELATASGTDLATITRLQGLGLLREGDVFPQSAIGRVRLVLALEREGVDLVALRRSIDAGTLTLDFVELLLVTPAPLLGTTRGKLLAELGLPAELVDPISAALGISTMGDDEPPRADDAELLGMAHRARELGASDEQIARIVRTMADSARRLVEAQRDFIDEVVLGPALARGLDATQALAATAATRMEYRVIARRLIEMLHERFVENAVFQNLVELAERSLAREGLLPDAGTVMPAIAFVDLTGYTSLAQERGDEIAAREASRFADLAARVAAEHEGTLIKVLGDGVMVRFPRPIDAVLGTLDLVERASDHGLPPLHAGVSTGPIVRRDGDLFGTTVNLASRTADQADPGEVLVTDAVVRSIGDGTETPVFEAVGHTTLRNVAEPVPLYRACVRT